MNQEKRRLIAAAWIASGLCFTHMSNAMGLRSLVALPVTEGTVIRLAYESATANTLTASVAFGINDKQTILASLPYKFSPLDQTADISFLYRYIVSQEDYYSGTNRLGLLAGAVLPTQDDARVAVQTGIVYTHFKNRHELDLDLIYQTETADRNSRARVDLSWQYRLLPAKRPEWGIASELNSIIELNGRWRDGNQVTQEITLGLQWIYPGWILETGWIKNIQDSEKDRFLLSARIHL